jgi:hypothetical protein
LLNEQRTVSARLGEIGVDVCVQSSMRVTSQQPKFCFVEERTRDKNTVLVDLDGEAMRGDVDGMLIVRERGDVRDTGTELVEGGVGARESRARVCV